MGECDLLYAALAFHNELISAGQLEDYFRGHKPGSPTPARDMLRDSAAVGPADLEHLDRRLLERKLARFGRDASAGRRLTPSSRHGAID